MDDGNLDEAERILRLVLERERAAAEVRNSLGLVLERRGRSTDAAREYAPNPHGSTPTPPNPGTTSETSRAASAEERDAERWYLAAIAADPYFVGAYNNLALLCQDRRTGRSGDRSLRTGAGEVSKNVVVMNNLASLYFATGRPVNPVLSGAKAVEADPKYSTRR